MLRSVMQSGDKSWTCSTDTELLDLDESCNAGFKYKYIQASANALCIYALQRCQVLHKPGNGLVFTVAMGNVIVSINLVSQSASHSLSVEPFQD